MVADGSGPRRAPIPLPDTPSTPGTAEVSPLPVRDSPERPEYPYQALQWSISRGSNQEEESQWVAYW